MKRWAVVVWSYFSCEFEVFEFIRAENPATAVKEAFIDKHKRGRVDKHQLEWVVNMSADLETMKTEFAQGEMAVEVKQVPESNTLVTPNIPPFTMTGQTRQNFTVHVCGK